MSSDQDTTIGNKEQIEGNPTLQLDDAAARALEDVPGEPDEDGGTEQESFEELAQPGDSMELFSEDAMLASEDDSDDEGDPDLLSVELEELKSTEIPVVAAPPVPPPIKPKDEDLLDTLEMPVFRVPPTTPKVAEAPSQDEEKANGESGLAEPRPIPLSSALKRSRKGKSKNGAVSEKDLLPDVVVSQPAGLLVEWKEGLPPEAQAANAAAEAQVRSGNASPRSSRPVDPLPPPPVVESKKDERQAPQGAIKVVPYDSDEDLVPVPGKHDPEPEPEHTLRPPRQTPVSRPAPPPSREESAPPREPRRPASRQQPERDDDMSGLVQELLGEDSPDEGTGRSQRSSWWEEIFTEEYFRTLPLGFHKQTVREAKFITESLGVGEGGTILDLCCGFGRHTLELAKRGYDMAGLDLSLPLLQKALNEAQRRNLSIKFIHGDVRELNFHEIFDGVFNFQTSFGYFDDRTNYNIFKGAFRALKPGGRFLIETVNRDHIIQTLPLRVWWEGTDCLFLEEVSFNFESSVLHTKRSFIYDDGRPPWEQNITIRLYSQHELMRMLETAGFVVATVSGHTATRGVFLGAASPQLIVLAERPI